MPKSTDNPELVIERRLSNHNQETWDVEGGMANLEKAMHNAGFTRRTIVYDSDERVYKCFDFADNTEWKSKDGTHWEKVENTPVNSAMFGKKFTKNDDGKLQWSLLPFKQLESTVRVLMAGAKKYSRDNWKNCDDVNRYKDALMRHVTAYIEGEKTDVKDKGGDDLPHLAHAICNCLFLMYFDELEDKKDVESE